MTRRHAEITYGAIAGSFVGPGFIIGRAWWAGDMTTVTGSQILMAATVGALAGALAYIIRGSGN